MSRGSHFSKATVLRREKESNKERDERREKREGVTILWPASTRRDPTLPQPPHKHGGLDKHCFMQPVDESSDSNYSPAELHCAGSPH